MDGLAYSCERCKFWLHNSCVHRQLPPQISAHPFHSQHKLSLLWSNHIDYICAKCFNLSRGHRYYCKDCDFSLEYPCAFSTNDEKNRLNDETPKKVRRFNKSLTLFNYRRVRKYEYTCSWCEMHLSEMSYGCLDEGVYIWFHDSCLIHIPSIIFKHPFHPSHPLPLRNIYIDNRLCNACNLPIWEFRKAYCCRKCEFHLHVHCAKLRPSLKVELHEHDLTFFRIKTNTATHLCRLCGFSFDAIGIESAFYRCVQCNFNYHFKCLTIPHFTSHKYHRHDLMLIDSFIEDDSKECYCDICEEERKPKHRVYCCKKCKFVAHIECALKKVTYHVPLRKILMLIFSLPQFADMKLDQGSTSSLLDSEASMSKVQIEHFDHLHLLSYNEAIEQNENLLCNACRQEIFDQHYACEDCKYYLHEMCTTLSYEVSHPLHRQHPLKLFTDIVEFTCHGCRDHSGGFAYMCLPCDFQLDVKCATSPILPKNERQKLKEMEKVSKVCPFNQNHKLDFFNHRPDLKDLALACDACKLPILGPGYTCRDCFNVKIHESCLALMREMQLTFHPLHPLYPQIGDWENCSACRFKIIERIGYSCRQCDFHLHLHCANSLKLALKIKSHMHNLYYFGPDYEKSYHLCNKCKSYIGKEPFYYCVECNMNLHLKCVPIPCPVKSKCHMHHLTLKNHFVEDDSGEYYCDICEEERNSKNHCYYCEECAGLFVAHIECVLLPEFEFADGNVHEFSNIQDANSPIDKSSMDKLLSEPHAEVYLNQNREKYWVDKKLHKYCFMLFARDFSITWAEDHRYWRWSYQRERNSDVLIDVAELLDVCWLEMHVSINVKKLSAKTLYGVVFVFKLTDKAYGWGIPVTFGFTLPNGYKVEHKEILMTKPIGVWTEIHIGEFTTSSEIVGELDIYCHEYDKLFWKGGLVVKGVTILPKN
ncbi:Cysteine/Histidine-rich C1 domain family protein [Theobroma cacao]|uniref:Cysteine/Histidine-rich C1 domain family protein n=1 Tax=Theobroma cacao TaxID=3641 RepID=A0A061G952_THECC|nr:Cysteine/Histidine-rich C1 domain family protein [Theobroma cacao]